MNQKNVKKREILSYKDFMKVSKDPWNPENLSKLCIVTGKQIGRAHV